MTNGKYKNSLMILIFGTLKKLDNSKEFQVHSKNKLTLKLRERNIDLNCQVKFYYPGNLN